MSKVYTACPEFYRGERSRSEVADKINKEIQADQKWHPIPFLHIYAI